MSMEITNSYSNLQSVLEAARKRTAAAEVKAPESVSKSEPVRMPKSAGGSLFERLYGATPEAKQAEPARLGTRFDLYA